MYIIDIYSLICHFKRKLVSVLNLKGMTYIMRSTQNPMNGRNLIYQGYVDIEGISWGPAGLRV
jgi:hypothetical protein